MNDTQIVQACNCLALRQAARFVTQLYERHLAPVGVTAAQFAIMANLSHRPEQRMSELADTLVMDRTTLLRAPSRCSATGWLPRPRPRTMRVRMHDLTAAGRHTCARAKIAWQAAQDEFEAQFAVRAKALRSELFGVIGQR
jgi:DNA-binding MarR family transcriptional regulator